MYKFGKNWYNVFEGEYKKRPSNGQIPLLKLNTLAFYLNS